MPTMQAAVRGMACAGTLPLGRRIRHDDSVKAEGAKEEGEAVSSYQPVDDGVPMSSPPGGATAVSPQTCGSSACAHEDQQADQQQQIIALLTEIRDHTRPQSQPVSNEQGALNVVRVVASELMAAAEALASCAKQLGADGKGFRARHAMEASHRARQAADGLIGG